MKKALPRKAGTQSGPQRIDPVEGAEDEEEGDHGDVGGQHHGREEDGEEDAAAGGAVAGEGVGDDRA